MITALKLKHFGYIQSLSFSVALANNLIAFALISLVPGFGETGVVISAGIMLFFSGLIEIPTGVLGDKIGHHKTVTIGLVLKTLSNILMIAAILAALLHQTTLLWSFIAAEALLDAIGSALISGSYQAAYNFWYKSDSSEKSAPPLFLASYKYGFWIRILFPLLTIIIGLQFIENIKSEVFFEQALIVIPLILITLLRIFVTILVSKDLKLITKIADTTNKESSTSDIGFSKIFEVIYITGPALISYSFFRFTQLSVTMIAIAEAYKIFKTIDSNYQFSWSSGLLLGLSVNLLNIFYSKFFYSKLAQLNKNTSIFIGSLIVIFLASLPLIISLTLGTNVFLHLFSIYSFCVFALMASQTSINLFQSIIPKIAPKELQASWLSCAEFIALVTFGLVLGSSLLFDSSFIGLKFLLSSILFWAISLLIFKTLHKIEIKSYVRLRFVLLTSTIIITSLFVIIVGSIFARTSYFNSLKVADSKRTENLSQLSTSVKSALLQGSFVEAIARVKGHRQLKETKCISLYYNNSSILKCDSTLKSRSNITSKKVIIRMGGSDLELGYITAYFDNSSIFQEVRRLFFQIIGIAFSIGLVFIIIFIQFLKVLNKSILNLVSATSQSRDGDSKYHSFIYEFNFLGEKILKAQKEVSESHVAKALTQNAQQVSHDIKSPLTALGMITMNLEGVEESTRIIIRSAVTRINDIANNLLVQHRSSKDELTTSTKVEMSKNILLPTLIDSIMTEKRLQFRDLIDIKITNNFEPSAYGVFSNIQPNEFKRVCSNLLNNAIEVLGNQGEVSVSLLKENNNAKLIIKDSGKGIPPEILATLGKRGVSHGKEEGNGLGLYHAITSVESWGGSLKIESLVGAGTSIIINLPIAKEPKWFAPSIELKAGMNICILDDDESIHHVWKTRFSKLKIEEKNIKVHNFSNPDKVIAWYAENQDKSKESNILFLMDFELLGHNKTGLDIIKELQIENSSFLVTSRYEDKDIINKVESGHMGLIPKSMASDIPLVFSEEAIEKEEDSALPITVLLDDDPLIHMIWDLSAKSKNVELKKFTNGPELLQEIDQFNKNTVFYIDSSLADDIKGEDVAKDIYNLGFHNLHLATGYEPSYFGKLDHIKSIVGKNTPWN